ncbi:hypothetical protein XAXN_06985 [Xanthomonas axonopodis]|uniref:Uncharacterized protein n=1 Tax=Xanthomonas axonopodis TaxID=53413 RepID=A0A0N8GDS5_9XANT|nr:hypothetical protein [Xanthomonas axonopodis]KPL49537.1 hypothetical protein XAXN_06985 [Xanthomonas axonopodis]
MGINIVQFQPGLSLTEFVDRYGTDHLGQEDLAAGLLALAQALGVTERQLHGSLLNVSGSCRASGRHRSEVP